MSVITELQCDVCGKRSADVKGWMLIERASVYAYQSTSEASDIIIDKDDAQFSCADVCGQECYHRWHAMKLAEYYDPGRSEGAKIELLNCAEIPKGSEISLDRQGGEV